MPTIFLAFHEMGRSWNISFLLIRWCYGPTWYKQCCPPSNPIQLCWTYWIIIPIAWLLFNLNSWDFLWCFILNLNHVNILRIWTFFSHNWQICPIWPSPMASLGHRRPDIHLSPPSFKYNSRSRYFLTNPFPDR